MIRVREEYHEEVSKYVDMMKSRMVWYGEYKPDTFAAKVKKFYSNFKWKLFGITWVVVAATLYHAEGFGLYDGTFVYLPGSTMMTFLTMTAAFKGERQQRLTTNLNALFEEHDEQWMREIREKYLGPAWRYLRYLKYYQSVIIFMYCFLTPLADIVCHYVFDISKEPITNPGHFSHLLSPNATWSWQLYTVTFANVWAITEQVLVLEWFVASYSLLTVFFLIELEIFKEKVKSMNFDVSQTAINEQFKVIVNWHAKIIRINDDLRSYLGLSGTFMSGLLALALTIAGFSVVTTDDEQVLVIYGAGVLTYTGAGFVCCWLGQKMEDESEEIFLEIYNLPWYSATAETRKSLNMMLRQARTPLSTDFHGYSMNMDNFAKILKSAYTYFTLLQSVLTEE